MEMEVDTPPQQLGPFSTVHVLQLIKDAQQQHGLRHGDYQRYRWAFIYEFQLTFIIVFQRILRQKDLQSPEGVKV